MDKIREALVDTWCRCFNCGSTSVAHPQKEYDDCDDAVDEALALLSSHVASDARELGLFALEVYRMVRNDAGHLATPTREHTKRAAALIERYVVDRERKAREEERENLFSLIPGLRYDFERQWKMGLALDAKLSAIKETAK